MVKKRICSVSGISAVKVSRMGSPIRIDFRSTAWPCLHGLREAGFAGSNSRRLKIVYGSSGWSWGGGIGQIAADKEFCSTFMVVFIGAYMETGRCLPF